MKHKILILILILSPATSNGRVFDFKQYSVATYLNGNIGMTNQGMQAYEKSSGANSVFEDAPNFNWGGEVGLLFTRNKVGIRLGYSLISPQKQSGIHAKNVAGTNLLTLESSIVGAFPSGHFEFYFKQDKTQRFLLSLGGGYGSITLKNSYTDITGYAASNFIEKGSNETYMASLGAGYEFLFTDNVTAMLDLGYRYIPKKDLKSDSSFTNIYGTTINKGDFLKNADGTNRTVNLSGFWTGLTFRFYINF